MSRKNFISDSYLMRPDDEVQVHVQPGFAQAASTTVSLNGAVLRSSVPDELHFALPGRGSDLNHALLVITTWVADIQAGTDETSVVFELTGGPQPLRKALQTTVPSGGSTSYVGVFDLELA